MALAIAAGAFGSLDTALNIAFPDLVDDFGLKVGDLQWVVVTYVLAFGASLLTAGQLGDNFGHRRVAAVGAATSTLALLACATAPGFVVLLLARVGQGVGAALVMSAAPALLTSRRSGEVGSGHGVGIFQTAAAAGLAIGPILGGPLVELAGWRAVFWFRVPLGAAVLLLALVGKGAPDDPSPQSMVGVRARSDSDRLAGVGPARVAEGTSESNAQDPQSSSRLDHAGVLALSIALGAAVLTINLGQVLGWANPVVLGGWIAGAVSVWWFVAASRQAANPAIDLRLLRDRGFRTALWAAVVANGAMFATWLLVPALLTDRIGTSTNLGGVVLAVSPIATTATAKPAAQLAVRFGPWRPSIAGLVVEAMAMAMLAFADTTWSSWMVAIGLAALGAGLGLFTVPNMAVVMDSLPSSRQGVSAGLSLMTRTVGIVVGVAIASAVFDHFEPTRGFEVAYRIVFLSSAAVLAAAAVLVIAAAPNNRDR